MFAWTFAQEQTMRAVLLASLVASILVTLPPAALQAQGGKVPKRPNLEEGADTNFAPAYYEFGMRKIERDPQKAADAFYWATRLDPAWAQPVYARRIALLMADPRLDRKSTRLNSSHTVISYAVFCLKKKKKEKNKNNKRKNKKKTHKYTKVTRKKDMKIEGKKAKSQP